MLALTLWPEWPWAVCVLGKPVENREWPPPEDVVGTDVVLHAGKSVGGRPSKVAMREGLNAMSCAASAVGVRLVSAEVQPDGRVRMTTIHPGCAEPRVTHIVPGSLVCVVRVAGVVDDKSDHPVADGPFYSGPFGWILEDVRPLSEPVACKGFQKLWQVPLPLVEQVYRQVPSAVRPRTEPVVINRHWYAGRPLPAPSVYCGRGTPLGNPYTVQEHGPGALGLYRRHLWQKIRDRDPGVLGALEEISPDHHIVCSCKPRPCHADIIVAAWRWLKRTTESNRP